MSQTNKSRAGAGLLLLIIKLGGKLLPFLAKLFKSAKVAKTGLAVGSVASYGLLFTWEFGVALVSMIFIHECGHAWAMRKCGMEVKGIYMIPLLGGVAMGKGNFPSRAAESFIALMGPVAGLGCAIIALIIFEITKIPMWAAISGWWALINLFNLIPINPLDGGRVASAIAFSLHHRLGLCVMAGGMILAIVASQYMGLGLLTFILGIGLLEFFFAYSRPKDSVPSMNRWQIAGSVAGYVALAGVLLGVMVWMQGQPGADLAMKLLRGEEL